MKQYITVKIPPDTEAERKRWTRVEIELERSSDGMSYKKKLWIDGKFMDSNPWFKLRKESA